MRLAGGEQGVGLHVPRTDSDPAATAGPLELGPSAGPDGEVVLEHGGLAVEEERPSRIDRQVVEDHVDGVDQIGRGRLRTAGTTRGPNGCGTRP